MKYAFVWVRFMSISSLVLPHESFPTICSHFCKLTTIADGSNDNVPIYNVEPIEIKNYNIVWSS